jgi:hypothetical protein
MTAGLLMAKVATFHGKNRHISWQKLPQKINRCIKKLLIFAMCLKK